MRISIISRILSNPIYINDLNNIIPYETTKEEEKEQKEEEEVLSKGELLLDQYIKGTPHPNLQLIDKNKIISIITDNLEQRIELAIRWLYQIHIQYHHVDLYPSLQIKDGICYNSHPYYNQILILILQALYNSIDYSTSKILSYFLCNIPIYSHIINDYLNEYAITPGLEKISLSCMRDLILNRPAIRYIILDLLLQCTCSKKDSLDNQLYV